MQESCDRRGPSWLIMKQMSVSLKKNVGWDSVREKGFE